MAYRDCPAVYGAILPELNGAVLFNWGVRNKFMAENKYDL